MEKRIKVSLDLHPDIARSVLNIIGHALATGTNILEEFSPEVRALTEQLAKDLEREVLAPIRGEFPK